MTSPRGPAVPGQYLDMLACHRLLRKRADAPEVNENIWFLPDLFTSQLGHMSWQVTRVQRGREESETAAVAVAYFFSLQRGDTRAAAQKHGAACSWLRKQPAESDRG